MLNKNNAQQCLLISEGLHEDINLRRRVTCRTIHLKEAQAGFSFLLWPFQHLSTVLAHLCHLSRSQFSTFAMMLNTRAEGRLLATPAVSAAVQPSLFPLSILTTTFPHRQSSSPFQALILGATPSSRTIPGQLPRHTPVVLAEKVQAY